MATAVLPARACARGRRLAATICLLLAAATLATFWEVREAGFVFDDGELIAGNARLAGGLSAENVRWAFTSFFRANWHPLTWLSHLAVVEGFGMAPGPHHVVNLLIHVAAALALFLALRGATGATWRSALVAALFALHPLRAESVAWVSERKDTLSALWWFLAVGAHVRYARRPGPGRYAAVVAALALGLLSKAMAVTLPVVLLLLDAWPLGRLRLRGAAPPSPELRRVLLEKLPLAALSGAVAAAAFLAQRSGRAVVALDALPLGERAANALLAVWAYLGMAAWPVRLGAYYPLPPAPPPPARVAVALALLLGATFAVVRLRRAAPYLVVGWLWYLIALAPVSGIVQVGGQACADRYTYLPLVGPAISLVWGAAALARRWPRLRGPVAAAAVAALVALAALCRVQVGYWRDDVALYRRTLAVTRDNWMIHGNLGQAYAARGERDAAIAEFRESLRIKPSFVLARYNLGITLAQAGKVDEGIAELRAALDYNRYDADVQRALGDLLERSGEGAQALTWYRLALQLRPEDAELRQLVGIRLLRDGDVAGAIRDLREGVRLAPGSATAHMNLGSALARAGEAAEAGAQLLEAMRLAPGSADARYNYANLLAGEGRTAEAVAAYREALRLKPDHLEARLNLATALYRGRRPQEAADELREALRIAPESAEAHGNLGAVMLGMGRKDEAERHLRRALALRPDLEPARRALEGIERPRGTAPAARGEGGARQ